MTDMFKVGFSRNAFLKTTNAPTEHAVGEGLTIALCGSSVRESKHWFALSPLACKRCVRVFNASRGGITMQAREALSASLLLRSLPMKGETQIQPQSDTETLARSFMGWKRGSEVYPDDAARPLDWYSQHNGTWWRKADWFWNPLTDANADLQVLERVREWPPVRICRFTDFLRIEVDASADLGYALVCRYTAGCYARAALAVLKEIEAEE